MRRKREKPMKLLRYQYAYKLMEKKDEKGERVPFDMRYVTLDGEVTEFKNVVTTSVYPRRRTRTILCKESGEVRSVHDVLILSVNDTKIVVN